MAGGGFGDQYLVTLRSDIPNGYNVLIDGAIATKNIPTTIIDRACAINVVNTSTNAYLEPALDFFLCALCLDPAFGNPEIIQVDSAVAQLNSQLTVGFMLYSLMYDTDLYILFNNASSGTDVTIGGVKLKGCTGAEYNGNEYSSLSVNGTTYNF